ncbi:MAG: flavin reductase family protein [Paracoccaceae bacterium]|nr:flavin reductase family protein [Paracoccaceae bacterium]
MNLKSEFLDAMSKLISSVHIVTTDGSFGKAGATVSSVTSVSVDSNSPIILCCLHKDSTAAPLIIKNECFCINTLKNNQKEVADVFSTRVSDNTDSKFQVSIFESLTTGAPVLSDCLISLDCRLLSSELIGTHHILIGEVQNLKTQPGLPLLYGNRGYVS